MKKIITSLGLLLLSLAFTFAQTNYESNVVVSTFAGGMLLDGQGTAAKFFGPQGICVDASGNLYVADASNHSIRKISPSGLVSTLAGSEAKASADGQGTAASFYNPSSVCVDASGNVYVTDNNRIRKISPSGLVSTFAGSGAGISGSLDGQGTAARFNQPLGVCVDASGNVYVADTENHQIRKISPTGLVSTIAGNGYWGSADGQGTAAFFNNPTGVCVDASGNVYVADAKNNKIRKISPIGLVSTLSGGAQGSADGQGTVASFSSPQGVCVDASGNVYVADAKNNKIRKISPTGLVGTLAGSGALGLEDGQGTAASFYSPVSVCVDASGNVFVADVGNHKIRKISPTGLVSTLAGSGAGISGSLDGQGTDASFKYPSGVCIDASGNLYVADAGNNKIRKISPSGLVSTFAGSGKQGSSDGQGTAASFNNPPDICIDASGNLYVADAGNNKIRKISPSGLVSTLAGSGAKGSADGQGTAASFYSPNGVCVDASGNVYVTDGSSNNKIRKISPNGLVSTLAGSGSQGAADGQGTAASFNRPQGVYVDALGNLYVADNIIAKFARLALVG